jgi:hypothetical protein
MGENVEAGSVYDIIDPITQLEVDSHKQQRIPILNIAIVMAALASLTTISITKKAMNKGNNNNNNAMFLFLVIGISLLSLSISAVMINAQASSSGSTTYGGSSSGNETGVTQMGICVVGAGGPCNGDSNFDGIHDKTR